MPRLLFTRVAISRVIRSTAAQEKEYLSSGITLLGSCLAVTARNTYNEEEIFISVAHVARGIDSINFAVLPG